MGTMMQTEQQRQRPINQLIRPGVLIGCFHRAGVENRYQLKRFVRSSLGHSGLQQNIYGTFAPRSDAPLAAASAKCRFARTAAPHLIVVARARHPFRKYIQESISKASSMLRITRGAQ